MPSDIPQGTTTEARLLADERFLRKVAYLYYEDGNSQEVIADMEHCSRQTVSKALQRAKERGIVRITVLPDLRAGYLRNLAREVRVELGLEDLVLVPGHGFDHMSFDETSEDIVIEIAAAAAEYLDQLLTNSDILTVSGGRMFMRNVVRHLKPNKLLPGLQVVASIGFVEPHTGLGDANLIAYDIAQTYGARHTWYATIAFIRERDSAIRLQVYGDASPEMSQAKAYEEISYIPMMQQAKALMDEANVMMMSLWPPHTNEDVIETGILTKEEVKMIQTYHPAVDINHWFFDASGKCINDMLDPPPYFSTGVDVPRLKERIRNQGTKVILVAGGGPAYAPAIRAALKAGVANILITDHVTAQLLLQPV